MSRELDPDCQVGDVLGLFWEVGLSDLGLRMVEQPPEALRRWMADGDPVQQVAALLRIFDG